ncbi:MAG: PLP-dependent aminotransferase family protein [Vicinamibacteria bacterium]|nr:PLP-dependent aminotransferase family protein [Vicinamibacteria bacterium]
MKESNSVTMVQQTLRQEVRRLGPGAKLSSVRQLMSEHRVSPGTVRLAMARLTAEGLLDARPGQGTFVASRPGPEVVEADFGWQGLALGSARVSADAIASLLTLPVPGAINLAGGYPAEELQATELVSRAMTRSARRPGVWGRMPLEGIEGLRSWFAQQLGPAVAPYEVLICPGSQSAINTAFNALAAPGAPVLIESPSYMGAMIAARAAGLRLVPVPTDRDGVRPEILAQAFESSGARLFYSQPTHANPTGATLALDRRQGLLDVVAQAGAILIEDDWCRDLSFEKTPMPPLVSHDRNGHCVYLRSLTKAAAPGLRIGAIVAKGAALSRLTASRVVSDFFVSGPIQETALDLVHSPGWPRHLRDVRARLLNRRDILASAMTQHFGDGSVTLLPAGGMHLWVRLESSMDEVAFATRAARAGVLVSAGRQWFPAEATGSYLRLSYACAPETSLRRAVEILARVKGETKNVKRSKPRSPRGPAPTRTGPGPSRTRPKSASA